MDSNDSPDIYPRGDRLCVRSSISLHVHVNAFTLVLKFPICLHTAVTCPSPALTVPNASLRYNGVLASAAASLARFMDSATWECDAGYEKAGGTTQPLRRVCSRSGDWVLDPDHQQLLVCQREYATTVGSGVDRVVLGFDFSLGQGLTRLSMYLL